MHLNCVQYCNLELGKYELWSSIMVIVMCFHLIGFLRSCHFDIGMKKSTLDKLIARTSFYIKVILTTKITSKFKRFVFCCFLNNAEMSTLFMSTWSPLLLPLLSAPFDNEHYKPTLDSLCTLSHFNPSTFIASIT
jgi:hypothetical protein